MSERLEIRYEQLPEWAKSEARAYLGEAKAPHAYTYVELYSDTVHVGGVTDEYSRRIVVAMNGKGERLAAASGFYDGLMNARHDERVAYFGGKVDIDRDGAILTVTHGYKINTIVLHARADGKYAPLATTQAEAQLPEWLAAVLRYYAGLNSQGRKDALWRYRIPPQMVQDGAVELEKHGFVKVNKRGAVTVTVEGRQASKDRFAKSLFSTDWKRLAEEWRSSK